MKTKKLIKIENLPVMEELSMNQLDNVVGGTDIDPRTCHGVSRMLQFKDLYLQKSNFLINSAITVR